MERLPSISELGKRLPIGFVDESGALHRDFSIRQWNWELEERLGDVTSDADTNVMRYVSHVVAESLETLGTVDLGKLNPLQRLSIVSRMYYSDVLFIYVWIRIEAFGRQLRIEPFPCERCHKSIENFVGDLHTLEVKEVATDALSRTVELEHGVRYADQIRKTLKVEPLRWAFFESGDFTTAIRNAAKLKLMTIQHGVAEVVGMPRPATLTREHVKTMHPREILQLVREIDQCGGGLVMGIGGACPYCHNEYQHVIDWRFSSFFGSSVQ